MTSSISQKDLRSRYSVVTPRPATFDRNTFQDPDDILDGTKEMIFRTLNSDVDALFYLASLLAERVRVRSANITTWMTTISENAYRAREADTEGSSDLVEELYDLADQMTVANGEEYTRLLTQFGSSVRGLVESQRSRGGAVTIGKTPLEARTESLVLVKKVLSELEALVKDLRRYRDAPVEYMKANFTSVLRARQARTAKTVLASNLNRDVLDLQRATVDAAMLHSALDLRAQLKYEVLTYKVEEQPVNQNGTGAGLYGGTVPFPYYTAPEVANFTLTELAGPGAASLTIPAATHPDLKFQVDPSFIEYSESGVLIASAVAAVTDIKSDGTGSVGGDVPWLKNYTKPGSITIRCVIDDGAGGSIDVVITDDGAGSWVATSVPPVVVLGAVGYDTGELIILIGGGLSLLLDSTMSCSYACYPMGNFRARTGTPGGPTVLDGIFDGVSLFTDNTLLSDALVTTVTDMGALVTALQGSSLQVVDGVLFTNVDYLLSAVGPSTGSCGRILLPGPNPVPVLISTAPFSPTFATVPTTVNDLLGGAGTYALGEDTQDDAILVTGDIDNRVDYLGVAQGTATVTAASVTLNDSSSVPVQVGDDLAIHFDGYTSHVKVLGVAGDVFTPVTPCPMPLDTGSTLRVWVAANVTVSRNRVFVCAASVPSTLLATNTAAGFTAGDLDYGYSNQFLLQTVGGSTPEDDFYAVHVGDMVYAVDGDQETLLGELMRVASGACTVKFTAEGFVYHPWNRSNAWPIVRVYPRGVYNCRQSQAGATAFIEDISAVLRNYEIEKVAHAYLFAGTQATEYFRIVSDVLGAAAQLTSGAAAVMHARVLLADELLSNLNGDRNRVVRELLLTCQFASLVHLTSGKLSDVATMEDLLVSLADEFGKGVGYVQKVTSSTGAPRYPGSE